MRFVVHDPAQGHRLCLDATFSNLLKSLINPLTLTSGPQVTPQLLWSVSFLVCLVPSLTCGGLEVCRPYHSRDVLFSLNDVKKSMRPSDVLLLISTWRRRLLVFPTVTLYHLIYPVGSLCRLSASRQPSSQVLLPTILGPAAYSVACIPVSHLRSQGCGS